MLDQLEIDLLSDRELGVIHNRLAQELLRRATAAVQKFSQEPGHADALSCARAYPGSLLSVLTFVLAAIEARGGLDKEAKAAIGLSNEIDFLNWALRDANNQNTSHRESDVSR